MNYLTCAYYLKCRMQIMQQHSAYGSYNKLHEVHMTNDFTFVRRWQWSFQLQSIHVINRPKVAHNAQPQYRTNLSLLMFMPFAASFMNNSLLQPMQHLSQSLHHDRSSSDSSCIVSDLVVIRIQIWTTRWPQNWQDEIWGLMCKDTTEISSNCHIQLSRGWVIR